jgi:hypothetical protein
VLALVVISIGLVSVLGAPAGDRSVAAPAPVRELALGENEGILRRVAFTTPCGGPRVWSLSSRQVTPLSGYSPCESGGSGGVYGLGFGTWLTLWATHTGGDARRHTVWLAVGRWPRWRAARRLVTVAQEGSDPAPVLIGEGRPNAVVYAVGRRIYHSVTGWKTPFWEAPARSLSIATALGYIVVRRADGPISVVTRHDARTLEYAAGEALAAKIYGQRIVVLRRGALDWYDGFRPRRTVRLPRARSYGDGYCGSPHCARAELRLEDVDRDLVAYVLRREVHVLRLTDGRDVIVRRPASGDVEAQLEGTGLAYSSGRRVSWVSIAEIRGRLARPR